FLPHTLPPQTYPLALHDALPISSSVRPRSTMLSGARSRATSARVRRSTSIDARSMVPGFKSKIATGHPADAHNAAQPTPMSPARSEEHTSELQSRVDLVCRLLLE